MKKIKITVNKQEATLPLTLDDAFQYAYLKWKDIAENGGADRTAAKRIPALNTFTDNAYCSYCHIFNETYAQCGKCPLIIVDVQEGILNRTCYSSRHPYSIWKSNGKTKQDAEKVLQLIIDTKPKKLPNDRKKNTAQK